MSISKNLRLFIFLCICLMTACNSSDPKGDSGSSGDTVDMGVGIPDTVYNSGVVLDPMGTDTALISPGEWTGVPPDRSPASIPDIADAKYGILGYSFPSFMSVYESKNIHAFISIKFSGSQVRDTLQTIIFEDEDSNNKDSIVIKERIPLFDYVSIDLIALDSFIKITNNIHPNSRQRLDTISGNKWSWTIRAESADRPSSRLKLVIRTENPQYFKERTIPIAIKVDTNFFRRIYNFLIENPSVLVVAILIPLITFIGKRFFKEKGKNEVPDEK